MLKIISRICLILLAAGIVCGGFYLYARSAGSNLNHLPGGSGEGHEFGANSTALSGSATTRHQFSNGDIPSGFRPEGGRERGGGSLMGAAGILGNLAIVALITALVGLVQWTAKKITRRRTAIPTA